MGRGIIALTASWGERETSLVRLFDVPKLPPRAMWLVSTEASSKQAACAVVSKHLVALLAARGR